MITDNAYITGGLLVFAVLAAAIIRRESLATGYWNTRGISNDSIHESRKFKPTTYVWGILPLASRFPTTQGSPNHIGRARSPLLAACLRSIARVQPDAVVITETNVGELVSPAMRRVIEENGGCGVLGVAGHESIRDAVALDILSNGAGGILLPLSTLMLERPIELEAARSAGVLTVVDTDVRATVTQKPVGEGGDDDIIPVLSWDPRVGGGHEVAEFALRLARRNPENYLYHGGLRHWLKDAGISQNVFPAAQIGLRDAHGMYVQMDRLLRTTVVKQQEGELRPRMIRLATENSRLLRREDAWVQKASISQIAEGGSTLGRMLDRLRLDNDATPEDFPLVYGTPVDTLEFEDLARTRGVVVQDS